MTRPAGPRALALLALLAAACAREPSVEVGPEGSPAEARRRLALAAAAGPVPLVVLRAAPRPSDPEAAALAAQGITGLEVRFRPVPASEPGPRLVLALDGLLEPARICEGPEPPAAPAAPGEPLVAAWCDGSEPVARVRAAGGGDRVARERLVWRATSRLFPDDYADSYGLSLFGLRVTVGGSFGF